MHHVRQPHGAVVRGVGGLIESLCRRLQITTHAIILITLLQQLDN